MKIKLITTVTDQTNPGWLHLKRSLDHFGWDYEPLGGIYQAYGSKMVKAYEYAKSHDYTRLFIIDGYDVFMLGSMEEAIERMPKGDLVFNAERGCWPFKDKWLPQYPVSGSPWNYLNGGACFVKTSTFIEMFERFPIQHQDNDQVNLTEIFLNNREDFKMALDTNCEVFQSIAFEHPGDFEYTPKKLVNKLTGTNPIILHGNGKTNLDRIYRLLN